MTMTWPETSSGTPVGRRPGPPRGSRQRAPAGGRHAPSAVEAFKVGQEAYQRGNFAAALEIFRPLAHEGHAEAQYNLGLMYGLGQGVEESYVHAHMWWTLAAEQGHAAAAKNRDIVAGGMSNEELKRSSNLAGSQRR